MLSVVPFALLGCWKTEFAVLTADSLDFVPASGGPADWSVSTFEADLECPDGARPSFAIVHPSDADPDDPPMPVAVIYHSGSFDFVLAPEAGEPLTGAHYAEPGRLDQTFAVRQVFATLGMTPDATGTEVHDGSFVAALAQRGVASLLAPNCWGDLWHNASGTAGNEFTADFFRRNGRTSAEWAFRFASEPLFRDVLGVTLPITPDIDRIYIVGLGEGSRAVGEVLSLDVDRDGDVDLFPAAALVDSPADNLRVVFEDPAEYGNAINGLLRIFPEGEDATDVGALWNAPISSAFGLVYSADDSAVPVGSNDALIDRLAGQTGAWVRPVVGSGHVWLDGADHELTAEAADWLVAAGR